MTNKTEWDGYGSYEAYINRGLSNLFNTDKVEGVPGEADHPSSDDVKQVAQQGKPRRRAKPKDVYDIVASYPHHEGDKQWLAGMLLRLPLAKREPVMLRYSQVYDSAHSVGVVSSSPLGQARRVSNEWLLGFIEQ